MATQPAAHMGRLMRADPVCRGAFIASVCWLACYAALTAAVQGSPTLTLFVGDILYLVPIIAAVIAASMAAHRLAARQRRLWLALAVAYGAQLGGETAWAGYDYLTDEGPPVPSIADIGYLTASAVTVLALLIGFGGVARLRRLRGMLDTVLILVALGGMGWQMLIRPQLSGDPLLADLVSIAYPILDIALLCCLSIVGFGGHRRVPLAVRLVGAATAVNAVSDMIYTYVSLFGTYASGGWVDFLFEVGAVMGFLGAVVAMRLREPPAEQRQFDRGLTVLPLLTATVATFTLIVFQKVTTGVVDDLTLAIVGVMFVSVLLRQYLFVADRATLAEQLGQALREQSRLAVTDGLTGLYNRRYFTERLVERGADTAPVSLLVIDLDHFKRVNDTFGHLAGDAVLRESAARIGSVCRPTDVVARYGGEEFVVLLPDTDEHEAVRIGERICGVLRETPVVDSAGTVSVSASIGVATHRGSDVHRLMERADRAMYRAKEEGRDRVAVVADAGPDAGHSGRTLEARDERPGPGPGQAADLDLVGPGTQQTPR
jgi:two-component system, cell cycle response regulator